MATLKELEDKLLKADAAGNFSDAKIIADEIRRQRSAATPAPAPVAAPVPAPVVQNNPAPGAGAFARPWKSPTGRYDPRTGLPDLRNLEKLPQAAQAVAGMGLRAGGPAAGQALGAATGPFAPALVPAFGAIGGVGGEALAQLNEGTFPRWGAMGTAAGFGLIPGASSARAGMTAGQAALRGAGQNLVAKVVETGIDEKRLPTLAEGLQATAMGGLGSYVGNKFTGPAQPATLTDYENAMAMRDASFAKLRPYGVKVVPSDVDRGSDLLGSLGGAQATRYQVIKDNQPKFQKLMSQDLGAGESVVPRSPEFFAGVRDKASASFAEMEAISERAAKKLEQLKKEKWTDSHAHGRAVQENDPETLLAMDPLVTQAGGKVRELGKARLEAQNAYAAMKAQKQGATYEDYKAKQDIVDGLEDDIEKAAISAAQTMGPKYAKLPERIRSDRRTIAKSYAYQSATNPSSGLVDVGLLGDQKWEAQLYGMKSKLDGHADAMADYGNNFNRTGREAGAAPGPNINQMQIQQAAQSMASGQPPGMIMGFLQRTSGPWARGKLLNEAAQNSFAAPRLAPTTSEDFIEAMARLGIQQQGRKPMFNVPQY